MLKAIGAVMIIIGLYMLYTGIRDLYAIRKAAQEKEERKIDHRFV